MLEKHAAADDAVAEASRAKSKQTAESKQIADIMQAAPDPTDLAMLGIDPDDLAGFGN